MKKKNLENTLFGHWLPRGIEDFLQEINPWWAEKPMRRLPRFRRWLFDIALQNLKNGLAPVIVLRGPRQVGKTTYKSK